MPTCPTTDPLEGMTSGLPCEVEGPHEYHKTTFIGGYHVWRDKENGSSVSDSEHADLHIQRDNVMDNDT